jgi:hypothetical protein
LRHSGLISLGALLIGLGLGWLIFSVIGVSIITLAWLLIVFGATIVASALLSWVFYLSTGRVVTTFFVGLVLALVILAGIPVFTGPGPVLKEQYQAFGGDTNLNELSFGVTDVNGAVRISTWDQAKYNVTIRMRARGWSDAENVQTLEQAVVSLNSRIDEGKLKLVLLISAPNQTWSKLSMDINVTLPTQAMTDLDIETTNGDIAVIRVSGGSMELGTVNGAIIFDTVIASTIRCSTVNGAVSGKVEASEMQASSVNGGIDLRLPSQRSGDYRLNLVNGGISVAVEPSTGRGFRVDLSTLNGAVELDLPNLTYDTNTARHKVAQTTGFDSSTIKIAVMAKTTNGGINVKADSAPV